MTLSRRRFVTICAAFAATPALSQPHSWQGRAFGAQVSLRLHGPPEASRAAILRARRLIGRIERQFSLYDPSSALVALNRTGRLRPEPMFHELMQAADQINALTDGLFDPTVQPLWNAVAKGQDPTEARALLGWNKVDLKPGHIRLAPGQALTFNGIAQGFATDKVADLLAGLGFGEVLVNIGEYRGTGGPWRLGLEDPVHGHLGTRTLTDGAVATSSPLATPLGRDGHILHASARPRWSSVSVMADRATVADGLSTALVLAQRGQVERIARLGLARHITLVATNGDIVTL